MLKISVSDELKSLIPGLTLSCIECDVQVFPGSNELWELINLNVDHVLSVHRLETISRIPPVAASRKAYKSCGKDPARYRLSAEALLRRIAKGLDLYRINNVVDLLNLVSFSAGFSIGGYDAAKIKGEAVFGIGKNGEIYEGVGRGILNIEGLPVFRDDIGAFGSPTSDSVRTSVTDETKRFLMVIISFEPDKNLQKATDLAIKLLGQFGHADKIETKLIDR